VFENQAYSSRCVRPARYITLCLVASLCLYASLSIAVLSFVVEVSNQIREMRLKVYMIFFSSQYEITAKLVESFRACESKGVTGT